MISSFAAIVSRNVGCNLNCTSFPILSKLQLRHFPTLQNRNYSQKLPRQPLPVLYDTMEMYVRSCIPFLSKAEFDATKKIALELVAPGEYGERLQGYLEERAKTTENWLADWFINVNYLEFRNPLVIWSSVGHTMPIHKPFKEEDDRLIYAAKVILAALDYKKIIDEGKLKVDKIEKSELDMAQYTKLFGTNRVPIPNRDCMTYNPDSKHIVVAYKNNFYAVNVIGSDCSRSSPDPEQLRSLLKEIVDNTKRTATPIGILTSHDRDSWAKARANLMEHPMNEESICLIEKALFVVCLDENLDFHDNMTRNAQQLMHGGGVCLNSGNRWFDKCLQFVFCMDGISGIIVERSSLEGRIIGNMVNFLVENINEDKKRPGTECFPTPKHLCFCYNDEAKRSIETAAEHIDNVAQDVDIWCFKFDDFGAAFLKSMFFSPNSFMQVAIQYAYYRLYCKPAAQCAPGTMRKFLHGRTGIIRSCTMESVNFARSMLHEDKSDIYRMLCLKQAADQYKEYERMVVDACGIDRHLLGLRLAARALNMGIPPLFTDVGFKRSTYMKLNTSKAKSRCDAFMCLGPLVLDGYGVSYNIRKQSINVAVTSIKSKKETDSRQFHEALEISLLDMRDLIVRVL